MLNKQQYADVFRLIGISNAHKNSLLLMESTPTGLSTGLLLLVSSARRNLRQVLSHPAFTPERRQRAELLLSAGTDAAQLLRWKMLALKECEAWEDAQLAREAQELGPAAHPDYAY